VLDVAIQHLVNDRAGADRALRADDDVPVAAHLDPAVVYLRPADRDDVVSALVEPRQLHVDRE
jgi:hypothetical protein